MNLLIIFKNINIKGNKLKNPNQKIPEHIITNKDLYDPYRKRRMKSTGMIKGCKPFNAVELVRKIRSGDS